MILPTKNCFHGDFPCLMTLEAHLVVWLWFPPTNFGQGTMTANDVRRAQNFDQVWWLWHKISHQLNGDSLDITGDGAVSQPPFSGSQPASHCWVMIWSSFSVGKCSYWLYQPPAPDPARKKRQLFSPRAQTAVTDRPSLLIAAKWEGSTKKTEIKIQWQSLVLSMNCICHLFVSFDKSCNYLFRFKRSTCRTQSCDVTWLWTTFFWAAKKRWAKCFKQISAPGR